MRVNKCVHTYIRIYVIHSYIQMQIQGVCVGVCKRFSCSSAVKFQICFIWFLCCFRSFSCSAASFCIFSFLCKIHTYIYAINATPTHLPPLSCLCAAFIWISCHMSHAVSCYTHRSTPPRSVPLRFCHHRSPLAPSDIVFVVIVIVVNVASDNITFAYFCANTRRPRQ